MRILSCLLYTMSRGLGSRLQVDPLSSVVWGYPTHNNLSCALPSKSGLEGLCVRLKVFVLYGLQGVDSGRGPGCTDH